MNTPRTEEARFAIWTDSRGERRRTKTDSVPVDFAECLETELTAAKARIAELEAEKARIIKGFSER